MIKVKKLHPNAVIPQYQSELAAGVDLVAVERVILAPGERAVVPTGLAIELPAGLEAQIRPRSGLAAKHGITVLNSPGTIDADYRGEIKVILLNTDRQNTMIVEAGIRIAQMVIAPYVNATFEEVNELGNTARGTGGLGSTGNA